MKLNSYHEIKIQVVYKDDKPGIINKDENLKILVMITIIMQGFMIKKLHTY